MKGKDKCEFLKGIRKRMAEANGIPYEPKECTYEGDCTGTCLFCEKEAAELLAELKKKEEQGEQIKKGMFCVEDEENSIQLYEAQMKQINEGNRLMGSLVNGQEGVETVAQAIDPFTGTNNTLMTEKELDELERILQEYEKPLTGDISHPYSALSEEDEETRALLQEEMERGERERKRGIVGKILANIKGPSLQGLIDEE